MQCRRIFRNAKENACVSTFDFESFSSSLYWEVIAMPLIIGGGPIGSLGVSLRLMVRELGNVNDLANAFRVLPAASATLRSWRTVWPCSLMSKTLGDRLSPSSQKYRTTLKDSASRSWGGRRITKCTEPSSPQLGSQGSSVFVILTQSGFRPHVV